MFLAQVAAAPILPLVADQLANNTKNQKVFFAFPLTFLCLFLCFHTSHKTAGPIWL